MADLHPGKFVAGYEIEAFIGKGGMGEVWAAYDSVMGRPVAIKSLHPQLIGNPAILARFQNEASTLAHLQHPNIVQLYDYLEEEGGAYLVMEYVEGQPLDEFIAKTSGPIPEALAFNLFFQMLKGLEFAHSKGVIHRDVKPSNFLVTPDKRVKVLDFGIAKLLESGGKHLTKTGTRLGTVFYMSPEQVQGQAVDQRSDIYSLGVTLFQMVTGQNPYKQDATEFTVLNAIVHKALPRANSLYPAVSPKVQSLIDKATEKKPAQRFQSCREFIRALEAPYQKSPKKGSKLPKLPRPNSPPPNPTRPKRKGRSWLGWLIGSLAALTAVLGFGLNNDWFPAIQESLGIGFSDEEEEVRKVSRQFLQAVEDRNETQANRLATKACREHVASFLLLSQDQPPRQFSIRKVTLDGLRAQSSYRYSGEDKVRYLDLERSKGFWQVSCAKENLTPETESSY